jgi:hypothetical protein
LVFQFWVLRGGGAFCAPGVGVSRFDFAGGFGWWGGRFWAGFCVEYDRRSGVVFGGFWWSFVVPGMARFFWVYLWPGRDPLAEAAALWGVLDRVVGDWLEEG